MRKDDARELDHAALEAVRIRAPGLVDEAKRTVWRAPRLLRNPWGSAVVGCRVGSPGTGGVVYGLKAQPLFERPPKRAGRKLNQPPNELTHAGDSLAA